jgi:CheY-like chemotaxis protein
MFRNGPILLVEDDQDDQEIMREIFQQVHISNPLICFSNGQQAFDYLLNGGDEPFLILSDLNMPVMGGIELRRKINSNEELKRKNIPFVFLTTTAGSAAVKEAYQMSVQGFFEKGSSMQDIGKMIRVLYDYWQMCRHPTH